MKRFTGESGFLANSVIILSGLVALLGGLGLLGWITGLRALSSVHLDYIPMAPDSAVALIILSIILLAVSRRTSSNNYILSFKILSGFISIYGLLKFIEYFFKIDLTFADILFPIEEWIKGAPVNRMSPMTGAMLFLTAGATYIKLHEQTGSHYKDVISLTGALVSLSGLVPTIGYLFGTPLLYGSSIIPIAAMTSVSFVLLGLALIIVAGSDNVILKPFVGSSIISLLLRAFLPLSVFAVFAQGFLNEWLSRHFDYNHSLLTVNVSLFFAILATYIVAKISHTVGGMVEGAEEALKQSEERYRKLSAMATEGIFIHRGGLILEANQAAATNLGFQDSADIIGKQGLDVINFVPESKQRVLEHIQHVSDEVYEIEITRFGESNRIVETHGKDIIWQGSKARLTYLDDITDRKLSEQALRDSEESFRAIFDSARDGLFVRPVLIGENSSFSQVNRAACEMLGYSAEELLKLTPYEIEFGKSQSEIKERVGTIITKGSHQFETEFRRKDGSTFPVDINLHVFSLHDQPMIVSIVRDISSRKQLEDQFRQAQKMEGIGRLAGGVAHDFNNLLTVITGHCELIMLSLNNSDPLKEDIVEIGNAADRAATLTRQLLAFSRKQALAPKIVNLNIIIRDLEKMLRRLIGEDILLHTTGAPDLRKIKVDPGQIEQVIINLVVNARDAMPNGGKLTIETSNIELDEEYVKLHPEMTVGPHAMLAVSDTGTGMTEKVKSQIFDPFFTTKPVGKGTGLGLSTVYGIVKQSGGSINVYSEVGQGTSFKIYFPIHDAESVDPVDNKLSDNSKLKGKETILIVEDEEAVRKISVKFLETYGYKVFSASNGKETIDFHLSSKIKIDLLLTDVRMPNMNGDELVVIMREHIPGLKVIYMSGYTADAVVHNGIIDSGTPYLAKPFGPIELVKKVRELLDSGK